MDCTLSTYSALLIAYLQVHRSKLIPICSSASKNSSLGQNFTRFSPWRYLFCLLGTFCSTCSSCCLNFVALLAVFMIFMRLDCSSTCVCVSECVLVWECASRINILRRPSVIYFYCNICSLNVYDDHFKPFLWPTAVRIAWITDPLLAAALMWAPVPQVPLGVFHSLHLCVSFTHSHSNSLSLSLSVCLCPCLHPQCC